MNCRDIESLILAERDGLLSAQDRALLSDHVAGCASCRRLRTGVATALEAYHAGLQAAPVPDPAAAWRELQVRLHAPDRRSTRRPLAPVIWFGGSLAAAAAFGVALFTLNPAPAPAPSAEATVAIVAPPPPPLHDPSIIAGADFVEAGDPNASTLVYVDKESGWLVVWATDIDADTKG